jgi:hypothetical protein
VLQIEVHAEGGREQIQPALLGARKTGPSHLLGTGNRIRLRNLKLSFNGCALKQNFTMMKRSIVIRGKLQLGPRSVKPKKWHGLRSTKWKQMNESGRLKLGPSVKL